MGNLKKMLNPESIALFGATETEGTIPRAILNNLTISYKGRIFPVNPGRKSVLGLKCFPSTDALPDPVDLAVIAVRAPLVPDIIDQCGRAGIEGALIISTGFAETGEQGRLMEEQLLEMTREYPIRIIGPGSIGIIRPDIGLNTTFLNVYPKPGNIAFILQKGELGDATLEWGVDAGIGFSIFASLGSMIDVDFSDMIDFLGDDDNTRSILLNMERISNAKKFMSAARGFARSKPIIVLKPGRFPESVNAAIPRNGTIPGDDQVYEAAFKRVGVVRVEAVKDLFNAAQVLDSNALPRGPSLAVIGNAGTVGTIAADMLIDAGGVLAELCDETIKELLSALPHHWNMKNPVDLGGDAGIDRYARAISICLQDSTVDAILVIHTPHAATIPLELARIISRIPNNFRKPVIVTLMGGQAVSEGINMLHTQNIPAYWTPEEAVKTYLQMFRYKKSLEMLYETPAELPMGQAPPNEYLRTFIRNAIKEGRLDLTPEESMNLLTNYGIPATEISVITTCNKVPDAVEKIGFPVIISSMPCRLDGDVKKQQIEIRTTEEIYNALETLKRKAKEKPEDSYLETFSIRKMPKDVDYELYLSMTRDRDFNSVLRFGLGGMGRDIFRDCAVGFPPLNQVLAKRLIEESKAYSVLKGYKGRKPLDLSLLQQIMINFSNLVVDFPEIEGIEIDPISVSDGKITALDVRICLDRNIQYCSGSYPHLVITPYPTSYNMTCRLRDKTEVILRPVRPEDEQMLQELFNGLSRQTMIERFFSPIRNMTHEKLTRFCNIDYDREIAIVAVLKEEEKNRILGISDIIIEHNTRAQFAVLIHDSYQGKGLGRKLIDVLIGIAREKGLDYIYGVVLAENTRMLTLLKKTGFRIRPGFYGTAEVVFNLK